MSARPIGIFVHHQGRGHAERAAALANNLIERRDVTLFCARPDIFPDLDLRIELVQLPSLFEPQGGEPPGLSDHPTPDTVHCAPLGWAQITRATATLATWFDQAQPALFVTDVSAELGQFARLCSVPHVSVLQHGDRRDPGHISSYRSAVGLLAPYSQRLEQEDRPKWMRAKTHYAPGIGCSVSDIPDKADARKWLGLPQDREIVLIIAGAGGEGTPNTPLTLGARAEPETLWVTIGRTRSEWHETSPGNLVHRGWVDNPSDYIAACDRIVSSCGNTTVHACLNAGKPWVVVPEWRYFDEQIEKAKVLEREGLAATSPHWPSHAGAWRDIWARAQVPRLAANEELFDAGAARKAAEWLDGLAGSIWAESASDHDALGIVG